MPMLKMKIQRCVDCPFFVKVKDTSWWSNDGSICWKKECKKANNDISDIYAIPDWCPLIAKPETSMKE